MGVLSVEVLEFGEFLFHPFVGKVLCIWGLESLLGDDQRSCHQLLLIFQFLSCNFVILCSLFQLLLVCQRRLSYLILIIHIIIDDRVLVGANISSNLRFRACEILQLQFLILADKVIDSKLRSKCCKIIILKLNFVFFSENSFLTSSDTDSLLKR